MTKYPETAEQAKPIIDDALRYIRLDVAVKLLWLILWDKVKTLVWLRYMRIRYKRHNV